MHWIIQDNLYLENKHNELRSFLERMDIPFTEVKVIPFSEGLSLDQCMEPYVNPEGLVMVSGSTTLAKIAANVGWTPGSFFNENHDYRVWNKHYGANLLNHNMIVCRFEDVGHEFEEFFIRPTADSKSFSGKVYSWHEFKEWQHKVINLNEVYTTLDSDTMVAYGPVKNIYREARFYVVDGKITTYSTYKLGRAIIHMAETPPEMIEYAQKMVDIWTPARAFVIDLALTDDNGSGPVKIIELGCINAAGFYDIDIQKFVMAIEEMKF